jgi:hypothetical protein
MNESNETLPKSAQPTKGVLKRTDLMRLFIDRLTILSDRSRQELADAVMSMQESALASSETTAQAAAAPSEVEVANSLLKQTLRYLYMAHEKAELSEGEIWKPAQRLIELIQVHLDNGPESGISWSHLQTGAKDE